MLVHGCSIHFTLNPGTQGLATTVVVNYGLDTTYGTVFTVPGTFSGTTDQPVTANLTALEQSTLYHFQVSATNSAGTTVSEDFTFTTLADAGTGLPVISGVTVTNIF